MSSYVNCSPVGDAWQDEKRGVARIYCVTGNMGDGVQDHW